MTATASSVLEAIGLTVVRSRRPILADIDLTIQEGEALAVMGPNGAGKSTLLKCFACALRPTYGTVGHFGEVGRTNYAAKRRIGLAGHETGLYAELTALENLVFAARMFGLPHPTRRAQTLLAAAGIERIAHQCVGQVSQGMRRRLAIARALVHDPPLILLDEPFVNLDRDGHRWMSELFEQWFSTRRTVCFASHDTAASRRFASRIIWLEAGRLVADESTLQHQERSRCSA